MQFDYITFYTILVRQNFVSVYNCMYKHKINFPFMENLKMQRCI